MRQLLGRTRAARVAAAWAGVVGVGLATQPLVGVHGPESALLVGLLLAPVIAGTTAWELAARRARGAAGPAREALVRSARGALLLVAIPTAILALNALRVRQCSPLEGLAFMALGPGIGGLLAALVGALVAAVISRPTPAALVATSIPLASYAATVWQLWATPAVFAYDPFAGFFQGAIYDELVEVRAPYLTYRALGLGWALALAALLSLGWDGAGRARIRCVARRPIALAAWLLLVAGLVFGAARGPTLGHRSDVTAMAEALGATALGARCTVHAPRELERREIVRLAEECDFRVDQLEARLGVRGTPRVRAFFFRDADEKGRLMGAAGTYIAKPWRHEVYLQIGPWPHAVLTHELAHVVAGALAPGPLRVPGEYAGLVPNPGVIEGLAVALAWDEREGLTPHEGARTLLELGRLPPLRSLLGPRFYSHAGPEAYAAAGSFFRHLSDTRGAAVVRRAYATGDVPAAAEASLATLERGWHAALRALPLRAEALELARARFAKRSIFASPCPHRVAALQRTLALEVGSGDFAAAEARCRDVLAIDPAAHGVRATRVASLARAGRLGEADEALAGLLAGRTGVPAPTVAAARAAVADARWARGDLDAARAAYVALLAMPQGEPDLRLLEAKRLAMDAAPRERQLLKDLLVGRDFRPPGPAAAVHLARELDRVRTDGLGAYLEARQLLGSTEYDLAAARLEVARARGLPTERLRREARRLQGLVLVALGSLDAARRAWETVASDPAARAVEIAEARDFLERIAWLEARTRARR